MSQGAWNTIKRSKRFYVNTYRRAGTILILSVMMNLFLGLVFYYLYFNQPEHNFYATDGVTPPVQLTPMDERNYTSIPLLASEPNNENETKVIPQ